MKKEIRMNKITPILFLIAVTGCYPPPALGPEGEMLLDESNGFIYKIFGYRVEMEDDPFEKKKKITQINNGGFGMGGGNKPFICLNLMATIDSNDPDAKELWLVPRYFGEDWLFIESVSILADEEKTDFKIESWDRKTEVTGSVRAGGTELISQKVLEWAVIKIDENLLNKWLGADEFLVRIYGDKYQQDVMYTGFIRGNWKSFRDEHLKP